MQASNVFSGPDALKDYYNPDKHPPLPLVELPEELNPFLQDGVHIYAKLLTMLPAHNVKALPALNMLQSDNIKPETKTVVEYSSGSTVISMAVVARILHGITDTRAYISNKTAESKLRLLQLFGLDLRLFGGPSQPSPEDDRGGIQRAKTHAQKDPSIVNLNQYENDQNWGAHVRWTGPQILAQLPNISVMCAGVGTAGTMTGIAMYLKKEKPSIVTVGVCTAPAAEPSSNPSSSHSGSASTCSKSARRQKHTLPRSISHGMASSADRLQASTSSGGRIDCAFICCDLPYTYVDEYFTKCDASVFKPIKDVNLLGVDKYRYDDAWELDMDSSQFDHVSASNDTVILDLRAPGSDQPWQKSASVIHVPLKSLAEGQQSPYHDSKLLEEQWVELAEHFDRPTASSLLKLDQLGQHTVLVLCYSGDTARMCSSILRGYGLTAFSVAGGSQKWRARAWVDSPLGSP